MRVTFEYVNYRGDRSKRVVEPLAIWYGETPFHPGQQWFLKAFDLDKQALRDFAMHDIQHWEPHAV